MPEILNQTAEAKWLLGLKGTTTPATIEKECLYTGQHDWERMAKTAGIVATASAKDTRPENAV